MARTKTAEKKKDRLQTPVPAELAPLQALLPDQPVTTPLSPGKAIVTVVESQDEAKGPTIVSWMEKWLADKIAPISNALNDASEQIDVIQENLKLHFLQKHLEVSGEESVSLPFDALTELVERARDLLGLQISDSERKKKLQQSAEIERQKKTPAKPVSLYDILQHDGPEQSDCADLEMVVDKSGSVHAPRLHAWDNKGRCKKCGFDLSELMYPNKYIQNIVDAQRAPDGSHPDVVLTIRTPLRSCRIVAKFATKDSKGNMVGTEYYAAWDYQNGKHFLPADHRSPRRIVSLVVCSEQKGVMVMNEGDAEYLSENRAVRGW